MKHKIQWHMCSWTTYVPRGFMRIIPLVTVEAGLGPMGITIWISEIIHLIFFINGMFLPGAMRGTQSGPEFSIFPLLQMNKITEKKNQSCVLSRLRFCWLFSASGQFGIMWRYLPYHFIYSGFWEDDTCPALQKQVGIFGYKRGIEILPVQSAGLLPPTLVRPGVHPKQ